MLHVLWFESAPLHHLDCLAWKQLQKSSSPGLADFRTDGVVIAHSHKPLPLLPFANSIPHPPIIRRFVKTPSHTPPHGLDNLPSR